MAKKAKSKSGTQKVKLPSPGQEKILNPGKKTVLTSKSKGKGKS